MLYKTINKYIPRLLAVLLAVLLAFGSAVSVFATEEIPSSDENAGMESTEGTAEQPEEEAPRVTSGSCGAGLEWNFSGGTLTITGSGAMTDFPENTMAPWYEIREEIIRIILPGEISKIGSLAFYDCMNIETINIPSSVETIGDYAFASCDGLSIVSIGGGIKRIGIGAFNGCKKLCSVTLPNGIQTIGKEAFYCCSSLNSVVIPSSVTSIGSASFAYCTSLVRAEMRCNISVLSDWMFFGCSMLSYVSIPDSVNSIGNDSFRNCTNLDTVIYGGESISGNELKKAVDDDVPGFESVGFVSDIPTAGAVSSGTTSSNGDGTVTENETTVLQGENILVSTTVTNTHPEDTLKGESSAEITVTVESDSGWEEAKKAVEEALKDYNKTISYTNSNTGTVELILYLKNTSTVNQEFINAIAGRNVSITVMTADGSVWKINGNDIDAESKTAAYNLAYELSYGGAEISEELGTGISFVLRFLEPAEVNAEVLIRIGPAYAKQSATLFQRDGELRRLQSAVVDNEGYAHFYLASVTEETEYYIAMNLPDAQQEAIIPENMLAEYGNPEYTEPIRYEITGRTSSWGMNLGQVMGILGAVMVTVIVVVGVTMFVLNKRKLRAGYVPQWEDEEE